MKNHTARPDRAARLRTTVLSVALLGAALGSGARAEVPEDWIRNPSIGNYRGYAEFKMANYDAAREIWEALARRGSGEAWFNLGILAEDGLGEPRALPRALERYEQAALAGSVKAAYRLGLLHAPEGPAPDEARARRFLAMAAQSGDDEARQRLLALERSHRADPTPFERAEALGAAGRPAEAAAIYRPLAEAGDARARTRLAWMHESGRGVRRDLDEAARLFLASAEAGDAEAQYAIAVMHETGRGRPQDTDAAMGWLRKAAAQGHGPARAALTERQGR